MSANDEHGSGFAGELDVRALFGPVSRQAWEREAESSLRGRPLASLATPSHEGLTIAPLFGPDDGPSVSEYPGVAPFTRGGRPVTRGGWEVCQLVRESEPETASAAIARELARGVDALWIRCDRTARRGVDPDVPGALDGNLDGVVLSSAGDLERLLAQVDLASTPVRFAAGAGAVAVAACHVAAADRRGVDRSALRGSFGVDPLAALAEDGVLEGGLEGDLQLLADMAAWARDNTPGVRAVEISTVPYHLAGASAVQEIALSLATGVEYLRSLHGTGVPVESAWLQMRLVTAVGRDLLLEIAKLRALRWTWARMVEACGGSSMARRVPVHAVTSPRTLTVRDPWVNILRGTVETFAAAVGGAEAVTCLPFDAAIGPSGELARRLAANTHTVVREEAHLDQVADPAGGSYAVERLTDQLAEAAWAAFQEIERRGGMAAALREGRVGDELARLLERRRKAIVTRRDPVTGVSTWPKLDERPVDGGSTDLAGVRTRLRARVEAHRSRHDASARLERLREAVRLPVRGGAVFAAAVEAAAAGATLGELARALRGDRGGTTTAPLPVEREAEPFERLRDASDLHLDRHGVRPRVFMANLGPVSVHTARSTFARNLFESGGIEAVDSDGFATVEEAVAGFSGAGTGLAVICSSDEVYAEQVPEVAAGLKGAGAKVVVVAGRPGEHERAWREAGVDRFVFLGCDVAGTLGEILTEMGVIHG